MTQEELEQYKEKYLYPFKEFDEDSPFKGRFDCHVLADIAFQLTRIADALKRPSFAEREADRLERRILCRKDTSPERNDFQNVPYPIYARSEEPMEPEPEPEPEAEGGHTPTPWRIVNTTAKGLYFIHDANNLSVISFLECDMELHQRIVRAVNGQQGLVDALAQVDVTLTIHGHVDRDTDLHKRIAAALRDAGGAA